MKTRLALFVALLVAFVSGTVPALAGTTGSITGSVHSSAGAPVAGAQVVINGPVSRQVTSDAQGNFSFADVPPGFYRVGVNKGGYVSAELDNVSVFADESLPLTVSLQVADLSSLRTIASVRTSSRSSINTGASALSIATRQQFTDLASPQINDIVQRIPGAVVEHGSSSPNTSITLAGAQGYETQMLLDGHPLSAGRYGVWFSQFFNSFLVQDIETEIGPGNTTPFAGTAVGGTANIVTPGFTSKPTYELTTGFDTFGSQYTNLLDTGKLGKLSYVVGAGYSGADSYYSDRYGCIIDPSTKSKWNTPGATGTIQFCGNLGGPQFSKGELVKGRWDFSPATSFEVGYVGSQGGYLPQGSAYGVNTGAITIAGCTGASGSQHCTNPAYSSYVGKTINGYFFYPGSNVFNNQPLFTAQLRTAVGDNTLLIRPYAGNIARIIDGAGEASYTNFYIPQGQAASTCTGSPNFGILGPTVGNLRECYNSAFSVLESDKLKGGTLSFIHPMGENSITGTYDYHSDETFAYYNTPSNVAVPDTTARYNTLSLTGDFGLTRNLSLKAGLYDTIWNLQGSQTGPIVTSNGKSKATTVPLNRSVSRFDPHIAFLLQPGAGTSYRLSFGTSTTFPYASQVSGLSSINQASGTGGVATLIQKNAALQPERASEFDLGVDKRFGNGSILSLDLIDTQISNVFETLVSPPDTPNPNYQLVNQPVNAAKLSSQVATLTYRKEPLRGFGYYVSGTLARSIPTGIPISSSSFTVPANGVQQCSDGGSSACIPYLKGYGHLSYTFKDDTYVGFGADFEGKNNTYFQPPFAVYDLTLRRPVRDLVDVQISVYNLFNTNSFGGLVLPNAGSPLIGENVSGQYGNYKAALPYPLIPVQPRDIRLQFRWHVNR
ncbi:MAG: TonB-dependent receptor domain-containing protein [Vulcanimicrobiaceae bacterium]